MGGPDPLLTQLPGWGGGSPSEIAAGPGSTSRSEEVRTAPTARSRSLGTMRVKFCGVTNLDDAAEAVRLGAWAIGMILFDGSPRYCEPGEMAEVGAAFRRKCEVVGVFVNPTLEEVDTAVENGGLTMVQLNGAEGASFCAEVARRTGLKVIKAIHVASAADVHGAEAYRTDFHLFDRRGKGLWGGTGQSFDWELLRGHRSEVPAILAGGLRPEKKAPEHSPVKGLAATGAKNTPGQR